MANNENIFQGNDIINDIYKDKLTKRENNKLKVEQNNNNLNPSTNTKNLNLFSLQEIDLAQSSQLQSSNNGSPILSSKEGKKRRIGIRFTENFIFNNEDKENNNTQYVDTSPNLINDNNKEKIKINESKFMDKLKNYEYFLKGYLIMIFIVLK